MSYQVRNAKRAAEPHIRLNHQERGPCFRYNGHLGAPHSTNRYFSTVEVLHAFCEVNNIQLDWAQEYGEPGYTAPAKGILFCNWNDVPKALQDRLEAQGYDMQWSDEWYVDSDNSPAKAWREQPDHMGWEPRVRARDGYMITPNSNPQEWIDSSLNEQDTPLPSWFDESELESRGFGKSATRHDPGNTLRSVFREFTKEGYDVILVNARSYEYDVWTRREAKRELFLSDARGIYIPRDFATGIDRACVTGVKMDDLDELAKGPPGGLDSEGEGCEHYWDIWQEVCDSAVITATDGTVYRIEQDGDCWLVEKAGEFCERDDKYYVHKE